MTRTGCFRTLFLALTLCSLAGLHAQCEADHTIVMADYYFAPSELTILPGETVAFINVQGTHDINGITNTLTGEPWNNPAEFYLQQTEGTEEGTCMGVVTFDIPGVYNFDSSIGFQAQLGMVGSITVDAFTLYDLTLEWNGEETAPQAWQSTWAMNNYCPEIMNGNEPHTVFLVSDPGVAALGEFMNLNQFDLLGMPDMQEILHYHTVPGIVLSENLFDGLSLPTVQGQEVTFAEGPNGWTVNGINIIDTDYTAFNGVIHIIDYGLAPEGLPQATVFEVVAQSPSHNLFEEALTDNFLSDDLIGQIILNDNEPAPGPFTVFAPTDAAWYTFAIENGFDGGVEELFESPYMAEILRRHIVEAPFESEDFFNGQNLNSYGGGSIQMSVNGGNIAADNANITIPDLLAYNGVVHVVNEVIDFEFPNPVGTCGTWTLNMYAPDGQGWDGVMQVLVDNVLVGEPSVLDGYESSYAFAVNEGSVVDMNYISTFSGWPGNFEVVDADGTVLFDSDSPANSSFQYGSAAGVYGLKACAEEAECSRIKVTLYSDFSGWDLGSLFVYDGLVLADVIGGYWFNGDALVGYVDLDEGSDVSFEVNGGYYSQYYSYRIEDENGDVLVDQVEQYVPAENVYGVVVCATSSVDDAAGLSDIRFAPNPAEGSVQLTGLGADIRWTLTVRTLLGQEVLSERGVGSTTLKLETLAAGTYQGQIQTDGGASFGLRLVVR